MSYRDHPPPQHPLIDLIPTHNEGLYVSDEEDSFYDEDDYLVHPKWKAMVTRATNRVPRRVQRYFVIYLALGTLALISWFTYLGPRYGAYRQDINDMDSEPSMRFGQNVRPEFKDMIQLMDMDKKHLPADDKRLVIVGDVHGCKKELEALLHKVQFREGNDHLVLTGDFISKGPDSPGVVSYAKKLGASCVRGNHEDRILLSIAESKQTHHAGLPGPDESADRSTDPMDETSFSHGDFKVRKLAKQFSHEQISWLKQCPVILRVGKVPHLGELVVVHAGLVPDIPLEQQDPFQVMNMRTIDLKTRLPSENRGGTPWEKFWNHHQAKLHKDERTTVVYGHDRKRGKNIQKYSKGLDSGCVAGGHLTAMIVDANGKTSFEQVKCKKDYTA
ncbi:ser/Thr protein phosphatase-like protein family [Corynespora cassiicola Philippines]|uniref:Ser/Thr protein phosphatase-like protein family n=1 Tax=Corynespora cassiicola Philippines TaxID=1448308 RepID=A0A2T2P8D9_CORCC|nr:ser/Thr protein phosphatase-like protein family [Corynespora cassiicola Philippines]